MYHVWVLPCVTALFLWPPITGHRIRVAYRMLIAVSGISLTVLHGIEPPWLMLWLVACICMLYIVRNHGPVRTRARNLGGSVIMTLLNMTYERRTFLINPLHIPSIYVHAVLILLGVLLLASDIGSLCEIWSMVYLLRFMISLVSAQAIGDFDTMFWMIEFGLASVYWSRDINVRGLARKFARND